MGRCRFWACAVLLSVSLGYAQTPQKRSGAVSRIDYSKQIQRLLQYEQHFQNVADRVAFRALVDALNESKQSACRVKQPCADRPPSTGAQMTEIENSLRTSQSDADAMAVMGLVAQNHCLSSRQLSSLIPTIKGESHRLDALIQMYRRVTDPKRFHTLLVLLKTSEARGRLVREIRKQMSTGAPSAAPNMPPVPKSR